MSLVRGHAKYWRGKAARFRELAEAAAPKIAAELRKLADDLDAHAAELEATPTSPRSSPS